MHSYRGHVTIDVVFCSCHVWTHSTTLHELLYYDSTLHELLYYDFIVTHFAKCVTMSWELSKFGKKGFLKNGINGIRTPDLWFAKILRYDHRYPGGVTSALVKIAYLY